MLYRFFFILFTLTLTAFNVSAQTAFSFSGLKWGERVESVVAQLAASGLPISSKIEKMACKVKSNCELNFLFYLQS